MLRYIHGSTFYFIFYFLPKMEAPNFESIFECISDGVNKVLVLVLFLFPATILGTTVFSKPLCRVTWPKYLSF